jgi:hypothetical protein
LELERGGAGGGVPDGYSKGAKLGV